MPNKNFLKNKQLYIWFFSYLVVVVVCITITLVLYSVSASITEEQIEENMQFTVEQMKFFYDTDLLGVQNFTYNILESNGVKSLINTNIPESYSVRRTQYNEICKNISAHTSNKIWQFYVVFSDFDLVLDSAGNSSKDALFLSRFSEYYPSAEEWLNDFNTGSEYAICKTLTNSTGAKEVCYIQRTPITTSTSTKAFAIVFLNTDQIIKDRLRFTETTDPVITILNQDNEVMFSSHPDIENQQTFQNSAEKYITTTISSQFMNWQYVLSLSSDSMYKSLHTMQLTAILCCLIFLIAGVALSYYFSKKSYFPLSALVTKFSSESPRGYQSEFSYLDDKINQMFDKNKKIEKDFDTQKNKLRELYLANLLLGHQEDFPDKKNHIQFKGNNFSLILFKVCNCGILVDDINDKNSTGTVNFLIQNVFTEITETMGECYFFNCENMYACILNSAVKNAELEICRKAEYTIEILQENFATQIISAVSDNAESEKQLPMLYRQAKDIISVSTQMPNAAVLASDSLDELSYVYSHETENSLLSFLKHGDYENASAVIEDIFTKNFSGRSLSHSLTHILFCDIAGTLLKFSASINENTQFLTMFNEVFHAEDVTQAKDVFLNYIKILCSLVKENYKSIDERITKITDFVHDNYNNPNLNVSYIANKFNITINYLSSYFKRKTGQILSDYILKYRLGKACELLEQNITVTEVCQSCGFCDVNAFIRAFKKHYGITPGKYIQSSK